MSQTTLSLVLKNLATYGIILLLYIILTLFFLRGIINSPGIIIGGDWGFPQSIIQMQRYVEAGFYTWSDREILGIEQFFLNDLPFRIFMTLIIKIGITGERYIKFFLVAAFVFPALTMYTLCRFFHCRKKVAFFAGYVYMTLPIFFNYVAMGWLFVLFSLGILPLSLMLFIKSVEQKKISYSILSGVLYSLASIQSQSIVWYPLVFLCFIPYLVRDKKTLLDYAKSLFFVFIVFLGLNAFWYLPLLFGGGHASVLNTKLATSTISLGTWARLSVLNILRGWGSLFNEPYEASIQNNLVFLSFLLPLVAYSSIYVFTKNRLVISFILLSLVPISLFTLGPEVIVKLPFSDVIRDIARFTVLSSFAYVVLLALVVNVMLDHQQKYIKIIGIIISILLVMNTYPFWLGELYGKQRLSYDIRLRTYSIPTEYSEVEKLLAKETADLKVLYLPIAGELSTLDDQRFYGAFKGIRDIFASFSPKPGTIGLSDRVKGITSGFILKIAEQMNQQDLRHLSRLLALMNVKYIVIRKNLTHPAYITGYDIFKILKKTNGLRLVKAWKTVAFFENQDSLSHLYIPEKILITNQDVNLISTIVSRENFKINSAIYFTSQNKRLKVLTQYNNTFFKTHNPFIEFKKINSTKYRVILHNVKNTFPLVFSEMYHSNWKLYPQELSKSNTQSKIKKLQYNKLFDSSNVIQNNSLSDGPIYETLFQKSFFENNHFIANGYSNSWLIEPEKLCYMSNSCHQNPDQSYEIEFVIEFFAQRFFYAGLGIGILTMIVSFTYLLMREVKPIFYRKIRHL